MQSSLCSGQTASAFSYLASSVLITSVKFFLKQNLLIRVYSPAVTLKQWFLWLVRVTTVGARNELPLFLSPFPQVRLPWRLTLIQYVFREDILHK